MNPSRREFLRLVNSAGAGAALSGLGLGSYLNTAHADHHCDAGSWGQLVGNVGGWTCDTHEGYKVLEIFLYLGAEQWSAFWLPGAGAPNFSDYGMGSMPFANVDWTQSVADFPCENPDVPLSATDFQLFSNNSAGANIYWGAATRPFYNRSDIYSRCRMVTIAHDLAVHQLAEQYVLTGLTLGNARSAGTGAPIQRRARAVTPDQVLPVSYVLHRNELVPRRAASAIGTHPGFARPVDIAISDDNGFVDSLARTGISAESDDLLLSLRHELRDRMRYTGIGDPVRSQGFDSYWAAAELLENAPSMQALFADDILVRDNNIAICAEHPNSVATTPRTGIKTMIGAAAELLGNGPARYVCAVDRGLSGTYDTHNTTGTTPTTPNINANIYNVIHHIAENIFDATNNPNGKINLNDTMIVISTDFNRTPLVPRPDGRDHWPGGGVSIMLGGPINGGPSIEGTIDPAGFTDPVFAYSPTDIRGAILLAAGVDPFADSNFRVSDFSPALTAGGFATEVGIRDRLKSVVLGA